jgi:hypothetical protein
MCTLRTTSIRWLKRIALVAGASLITLLAVRVWDTQRGLPLSPWHTHVLQDMEATAIARTDWAGYLRAEQALFDNLRREVTDRLPAADRVPSNRYFDGSPIYPGRFRNDWNRSYTLAPSGPVVGSVVLLHGLTDSPYSLRHVARRYVEHGYRAVAIRLPSLRAAAQCGACYASLLGIVVRTTTFVASLAFIRISPGSAACGGCAEAPWGDRAPGRDARIRCGKSSALPACRAR